jgi:hypothetical protein
MNLSRSARVLLKSNRLTCVKKYDFTSRKVIKDCLKGGCVIGGTVTSGPINFDTEDWDISWALTAANFQKHLHWSPEYVS